MFRKILLLLILILLLSACNNETETAEQKELREKLIEITQIVGNRQVEKIDIDYAINDAVSLGLKGKERDRFVRSYLIYITTDKEVAREKVYEDSQLRIRYEEAWQDLAFEKYGIKVDEEKLQKRIEEDLSALNKVVDSGDAVQGVNVFYLAEALGYSIDEFLYIFERHNYERWIISESLYPLLQKEYDLNDNIEISNKYRIEVIDYIVKSQS